MDRRHLLSAVIGTSASLALPWPSRAEETILGETPNGTLKRAWVARPQLIRQRCQQWCWAASISMIFAAHGKSVSQERIVASVYPNLSCSPSGPTINMVAALSRSWDEDGDGDSFSASLTGAYDPMNGVNALTNAFLINELAEDRPLLYGNQHHAMVVVACDYIENAMGVFPQAVGVLDPWPYSPAFHPLTPAEMVPMQLGGEMLFLAAVNID